METNVAFDTLLNLANQTLECAEAYSKLDAPIMDNIGQLISKLRQSISFLENMEHKDIVEDDDEDDEDDVIDNVDDDDDEDPAIVGICDMLMDIKYSKRDELSTFDSEYDKVWGRIDAARAANHL